MEERKNKLVVSMTSWTKRIQFVKSVLQGVLQNTMKPDIVFLNLSVEEFPKRDEQLPKDLVEYIKGSPSVKLNWVEGPNTKPFKKMFPILKYLEDDDLIIIVDDDCIIQNKLIETRVKEFNEHNGKCAISGGRCFASHCNIDLLGIMRYNTVCPTTIMQKKMLNGWEEFLVEDVLKTNHDDCLYSMLILLNGYSIFASKYMNVVRGSAAAAFGMHDRRMCYSDSGAIKVIERRYNEIHTDVKFKDAIINAKNKKSIDSLNIVLCDSKMVAGDNAEYFYRKARVLYPNLHMTFILSNKSQDWKRLEKDGFNLYPVEGAGLRGVLDKADYVLWSKEIPEGVNKNKVIFLQHGTTSDLSNDGGYMSQSVASAAKYICCSSQIESNLLEEYSKDKLTPILTGMPRRDILLEKNNVYQATNHPKQVFISFHWRYGILDNFKYAFMGSVYFKKINELLNSKKLKDLHDQGVKIVFLPHARFMKYKDLFKRPSYVELATKPFQDNLVESDVLITDFSSNSFEMAYMNKPTICYIPDEDYVKDSMKQYHIENIDKYPHLFRCKTIDEIGTKLSEFIKADQKFDFAQKLFQYADQDNTKRLVEWMFSHKLEQANRDVKMPSVSVQEKLDRLVRKANKRRDDYFAKNLARFRFG